MEEIIVREMSQEEIVVIMAATVITEIIIRILTTMITMGCICNVWNVCVTNLYVFIYFNFNSLKWSRWAFYKFYCIEILYLLQIGLIG